jgi:hypothetical protein
MRMRAVLLYLRINRLANNASVRDYRTRVFGRTALAVDRDKRSRPPARRLLSSKRPFYWMTTAAMPAIANCVTVYTMLTAIPNVVTRSMTNGGFRYTDRKRGFEADNHGRYARNRHCACRRVLEAYDSDGIEVSFCCRFRRKWVVRSCSDCGLSRCCSVDVDVRCTLQG